MKVLILGHGQDGCTWYRMIQPGRMLARLGLAQVKITSPLEPPEQRAQDLAAADVVYLGRVRGNHLLKLTHGLHEQGRAVVYDADDDLFNVSPLNDSYRDWGTEEVQVQFPDGGTQILWADQARRRELPGLPPGRFLDLEANRRQVADLRQALAQVDAITVTTEELARCYRGYGPPVFVLPNCIDFAMWQPVELRRSREAVRMGWAGGSSHFEDLNQLRGVLASLRRQRPQTHLWMQGVCFPAITQDWPPERLRTWDWVHPEAHPWRSAVVAPDLALIPLRDTIFNRRKSPIKWLEYAALGVPAVCSDLPPYAPVVVHGVNGLLAATPEAWEAQLLRLVDDPLYRAKLGGRALETARACFDQRANAHLWAQALEAGLAQQRRAA